MTGCDGDRVTLRLSSHEQRWIPIRRLPVQATGRRGPAGLSPRFSFLNASRSKFLFEKERKEMGRGERRGGLGRLGCFAGLGWILGLGFLLFFSFLLFQTNSNHLNSNLNLNSTLALKQIKQCTSKNATTGLNLEIFLITCERKIKFIIKC